MITKVTTNMCGTLMPDGSAQTSVRPVFLASSIGEPGVVERAQEQHQPGAPAGCGRTPASSGIFSTKRSRPVSTSRLTRMLVPNPKKAFQSPGTQSFGLAGVVAFAIAAAPSVLARHCARQAPR